LRTSALELRKLKMRMAAHKLLLRLGLALAIPVHAQQTKAPALDDILQRLETNLDQYDSRVPSLFCDEHVVSQVTPGIRDQNTVTDSVFRIKRIVAHDRSTTLDESREVKTVNGQLSKSQDIAGPSILSGIFEGALAVVSRSQTACMNYTLERPPKRDPAAPYIIRFASVITPQNSANCLLQEEGKGRVFVDPASMQITRMELTTPHHTIIPGSGWASPIKGEWVLAVDYAPVTLGGQTFWMPTVITSREASGAGTFHQIVWTYRATYRNFHKLEVTSHIVPANESPGK
jgi:hypothetical protein